MPEYGNWTTEDELKWVRGLGKRKHPGSISTRLDLLIKAEKSYAQRVLWDMISKNTVLEVLHREITKEEKECTR